MEASQNVLNQRRALPQKLSDEAQTKKLMTIQNNAHLIALQSASAQLKHENQDKNAAMVETTLAPFKEYESLRTSNNDPNQPKAFISQGLTHDQVLAKGPNGQPAHRLSDSNVIQDGWVSKWNDATNQMEPEPTYAVLNDQLKDVTLPKNVTDMLNKVNSQWKDIHQVVGGTVRVPVNAYVSAMHDYSAVVTGQQILETLNETVNGKDAKPLSVDAVAAAARAGSRQGSEYSPSTLQFDSCRLRAETCPEMTSVPTISAHFIQTSPNGNDILNLIGLTPQTADAAMQKFNNERIRQAEIAKTGGVGDKAIAQPSQVAAVVAAAKKLPAEYQPTILSGVNPTGMTVGELEKLKDKVLDTQKHVDDLEQKKLTQGGDPVVQSKTANNIIEGDVARLDRITSIRGNARQELFDAIHDEAQRRGLDTTQFQPCGIGEQIEYRQ